MRNVAGAIEKRLARTMQNMPLRVPGFSPGWFHPGLVSEPSVVSEPRQVSEP
jgi:hypothetical protein